MANTDLLATEIGHQIDLIRYGSTLGKAVNPKLTAISKKVRQVLYEYETIATIKTRDAIIKELTEYINTQLGEFTTELSSELNGLVSSEIAHEYSTVKAVIGKGVKLEKPLVDVARKAIQKSHMVLNGDSISVADRIGDYPANQIKAVKQKIIGGWKDGLTTRDIARSITGTATQKGVIQTSQRSAYSMTKDLTSHISSEVKADFGKKNDDIIVGEKVIVTLDSKTSPICQDYGSQDGGGKEYYYAKDGRNFPRPPFHYNCRSTMSYILNDKYKALQEGGTRPAIVDGKVIQVDANTNWMDLAKAHPELAKQSLGPTKAKILDNMSAKEFTDAAYTNLNTPITIEQMTKNSDAARKALEK